jgi:hypothetical protein
MISLFDYLGKAAGMELGGKVYQYSLIRGVEPGLRYVSTLSYRGPIALYPKEFLDEFFRVQEMFS